MFIHPKLLLIFGICFIAANTAYAQSPSPQLLEDGKNTYNAFCIHCHGIDGSGTGPAGALSGVPTGDLSDKAYMSLLTDDEIIERVAYGEERFPYLQMPGWRSNLSNEKIVAIVSYVRTLAVDKGPLTGLTPTERLTKFKTDPLHRGKIYYLRYCSSCHGEKGDGKGLMANKTLKKPIAIGSPEIASALTYEEVKIYVTNIKRWSETYMPIFPEKEILDKLEEIIAYIKTLPEQQGK